MTGTPGNVFFFFFWSRGLKASEEGGSAYEKFNWG
jgi:hypothetical protein